MTNEQKSNEKKSDISLPVAPLRTRVILESPYAGDVEGNVKYARECVQDSLLRGEAPYASHLLYPGALDDNVPEQREYGIAAGLAWGAVAEKTVVYTDRGISLGMQHGIADAVKKERPVEWRTLMKCPRCGGKMECSVQVGGNRIAVLSTCREKH